MLLEANYRAAPASYVDSSDTPHDNTSDRQSAPTLNTSDIHKHTTTSPKNKKKTQTRLI